MKYHEKVDLRSPIFKYSNSRQGLPKSPTKSPMKSLKNPSQLFQRVCCPNCKYSFKIIKNQSIAEIKSNVQNLSPKIMAGRTVAQTQTQSKNKNINFNNFVQGQSKNTSPNQKISSFYNQSPAKNSQLSNRHKSSAFINSNQKSLEQSMLKTQEFKFKPLQKITTPRDSRSNKINSKSKCNNNLMNTLHPDSIKNISNSNRITQNLKEQSKKTQKIEQNLRETQVIQQERAQIHQSSHTSKTITTPRKINEKIQAYQMQNNLRPSFYQHQLSPMTRQASSTSVQKYLQIKKRIGEQKMIGSQDTIASKRNDMVKRDRFSKTAQGELLSSIPVRCQQCKKQLKVGQQGQDVQVNKENPNFKHKQVCQSIRNYIIECQSSLKCKKELQNFCNEIEGQLEIPSYCKMMLASEMDTSVHNAKEQKPIASIEG